MNDNSWKVKINESPVDGLNDVFIYSRGPSGMTQLFRNGIIDTIPTDGAVVEPSLKLSREMLLAFAEALDKNGIKPSGYFVEGKLEATEKHLEDMRTLVFKKV